MESQIPAVNYSVLNELRLEGSFFDVVICVSGVEFPAHKNVLCCCSPYFRTLFSEGLNQNNDKVYNIQGISPEMMEMIIIFAYTQTVPVTRDNVDQLMAVANHFNISGLLRICSDFLEAHLHLHNCIGICRLAYYYSCPKLRISAFKFILQKFEELVMVSEEFLQLTFAELCDIIERDELNVRNESLVFTAVLKWTSHHPHDRNGFLTRLLSKVRLSLIDQDLFLDNVKNNEYVKSNKYCKSLVYIAFLQAMYDLSFNVSGASLCCYRSVHSRLPFSVLLSIGGWSGNRPTNAIEAYDSRAKVWTDVICEDGPPRGFLGTAYLKGYIYLIGGSSILGFYNKVCSFDPVKKVWQEVAPMHTCRGYVSVVVLNDLIYAMGGYDGLTRFNTVEKYNSDTNQWTLLSAMHEHRSDASATTLHGKIYICGGFNGDNCLFTAEMYNPGVDQWSLIAPMMTQRSGMGVIAYNDEVYAVGGFDGDNCVNTVEAYNPVTDTWRTVSSMIMPRSNFGIETMEGLLYIVGGFDGFSTSAKVESYNKDTNEWKEVPDMNTGRSEFSCCVLSGLPNIRDYVVYREPPAPVCLSVERRLSPFYNIPL
ncbi:KLH10 protein, partial [Polypterus senegalus]